MYGLEGVTVGQNLQNRTDTPELYRILCSLTGISRKEATQVEGYVLTGDNLLKILAIHCRLASDIPVVLVGECGCGKTSLINFYCKFRNVPLVVLDCHGGTTEAEVIATFAKAEALLRASEETAARNEVEVTMDLTSPLGADFKADGTVKMVEPNSQLALIGQVGPGDRVMKAGGNSIETFDQLKSVLQGLKSVGTKTLSLTFRKVQFLEAMCFNLFALVVS